MSETAVRMARRIEEWPIDRLKPYENNARTHSEEQVVRLAAMISEFGFNVPILVDGNAGIIAGHGRLEAARRLGLDMVPVIELTHLSEVQKRAYIIADNKIALEAGWDEALLAQELQEIEHAGFDLDMTGFTEEELRKLLGDGEAVPINVGEGEGASGVSVDKLRFGKNQVELSADELNLLEDKLQQYTDSYGGTFGFVSWLVEGAGNGA